MNIIGGLVSQRIAAQYQVLFDLMYNQHGVTLTISEMDEIISEARELIIIREK